MFSLISSLPSSLSADVLSVVVRMIHRYYAADRYSSQTYMRAVWPKPSPAVLRLTFAAGVCEVSRFSCLEVF